MGLFGNKGERARASEQIDPEELLKKEIGQMGQIELQDLLKKLGLATGIAEERQDGELLIRITTKMDDIQERLSKLSRS